MTARVARVLLDSPLPQLDHLFDYAIPDVMQGEVLVGSRVRVPLRMGNRRVDAHVVELAASSSFGGDLQSIDSVITSVALLPPQLYALARRIADRHAGSASDVLRLAIPPRYVRVEKAFTSPEGVAARAEQRARSAERRRLEGARELGDTHPFAFIAPGTCRSIVMPTGVDRAGDDDVPVWATFVAQAARDTISQGNSVIIATPTYRDADDVGLALSAEGLDDVSVRADSRQTGGERYAAYLRTLEPHPVVVVGNRSALYAPAHNLGLVVVWDDGDSTMAEPHAPYAHARDVALVASQLTGARLVFASFVPSADVQRLVDVGFASDWTAPRKSYPKVIPTDALTSEQSHARIPSVAWSHAREQSRIGPVLVQVARPGYAPSLCCAKCRTRAVCAVCSGPLATRNQGAVPFCRWCGQLATQWSCPACAHTRLRLISAGSERTAEELGRAFPDTRVIVSDAAHLVTRVDDKPSLVVSTPGAEPIAAHGYRSVIVLDGESYRSRAGLRSDEDAVRHWVNAFALANPSSTCFLVGGGPELSTAISTWQLRAFASAQVSERRMVGLPPVKRAAIVTGTLADVASAVDAVKVIGATRVMGPTPDGDDSRAIVLFDYKDGDAVTSALRAAIVMTATRGGRRRHGSAHPERVARLRVRVDDSELEDSMQ